MVIAIARIVAAMKSEVDLAIADATKAIELDPKLVVAYRIRAHD